MSDEQRTGTTNFYQMGDNKNTESQEHCQSSEAVCYTRNACEQKEYKKNEDVTLEEWRDMAYKLWDLLDDIDTAGDMFKPEINTYFNYICKKVAMRFKQIGSDGYDLFVNKERV